MKEQNEKQAIEEMARIIHGTPFSDMHRAVALYNAGYRKQRVGEWTKHIDEWDCEYAKCSCCGEEFYDATGEDTIDMFYNFCPNCGAKMKGGE
jgi:DNA-directed RNA polymerase subunit RPC12/RpoP